MLQTREEYNVPSLLLKSDKNEAIFRMLGENCQSLNTAVVRIDKTEASAYLQEFTNKQTCVVCFVRDRDKCSYFIRAYCLINHQLIWQHELYDDTKIKQVRSLQLTFKGKNGQMHLNFLSKDECNSFYYAVANRSKIVQLRNNNPKSGTVSLEPSQVTPSTKKKVNKVDISDPFDPRCLEHKGWDNTVLSYFLQKADVSEQQLNDRNTKNSIFEFINRQSQNVLDTVKLEIAEEIGKKSTSTMTPPPPPPPPPPPIIGSRDNTPTSKPLPKTKPTHILPPVPDAHNDIMKSIQDGVKLKKTPYSKRIEETSTESIDNASKSSTKPINKDPVKDSLDKALQTPNADASCLNSIHDSIPLLKDSRSVYVSSVSNFATKPETDQCELPTNHVGNKVSFTDDLINALQKTLDGPSHTKLYDDESTDSEWDD